MLNTPKNISDLLNDERFVKWVRHPDQEDMAYWDKWKSENPQRLEDMEEARKMIMLMDFKPIHVPDQAIEAIRRGYTRKVAGPKAPHGKGVLMFARVAAIIVLLMTAVFWVVSVAEYQPRTMEKLVTVKGEKSMVTLPDGSVVWLNGGSRLVYDRYFTVDDERKVYLEGEAFFDVVHDSSRPFVVETGALDVVVKGTSFNVSSYPEEHAVETILVDGSVEIHTQGTSLTLQPDQQAIYQKATKRILLKKVNAHRLSSWKKGMLIFENERLSGVARKLERWYGVPIEIEKGGDCRVSAKFENETLQEVLELFQLTSRISYKRLGRKIALTIECQK